MKYFYIVDGYNGGEVKDYAYTRGEAEALLREIVWKIDKEDDGSETSYSGEMWAEHAEIIDQTELDERMRDPDDDSGDSYRGDAAVGLTLLR